MVAPGLRRLVGLLQDDVLAAGLLQVVAQRQPALTPTDDQGIDLTVHTDFPFLFFARITKA